jgi:hypothetical protein
MQRNFRIEVYLHATGSERAPRERSLDDVIAAPSEDKARELAKARLEASGLTVLGVSHGPNDTLVARVKRGAPQQPALVSGGVIR